jgi:hypothetical protein
MRDQNSDLTFFGIIAFPDNIIPLSKIKGFVTLKEVKLLLIDFGVGLGIGAFAKRNLSGQIGKRTF